MKTIKKDFLLTIIIACTLAGITLIIASPDKLKLYSGLIHIISNFTSLFLFLILFMGIKEKFNKKLIYIAGFFLFNFTAHLLALILQIFFQVEHSFSIISIIFEELAYLLLTIGVFQLSSIPEEKTLIPASYRIIYPILLVFLLSPIFYAVLTSQIEPIKKIIHFSWLLWDCIILYALCRINLTSEKREPFGKIWTLVILAILADLIGNIYLNYHPSAYSEINQLISKGLMQSVEIFNDIIAAAIPIILLRYYLTSAMDKFKISFATILTTTYLFFSLILLFIYGFINGWTENYFAGKYYKIFPWSSYFSPEDIVKVGLIEISILIGSFLLAFVMGTLMAKVHSAPLRKFSKVIEDTANTEPLSYNPQPLILEELDSISQDINILVDKIKEREKELYERHRELATLQSVSAAISRSFNVNDVLSEALDNILTWSHASSGTIYTINGENLKPAAARGIDTSNYPLLREADKNQDIIKKMVSEGEAFFYDNFEIQHSKKVASAWIPLRCKENIVGIFTLYRDSAKAFTPQEKELLITMGSQMGVAIENARLFAFQLDEEKRRQTIYKNVILAVTNGKLILTETEDIKNIYSKAGFLKEFNIASPEDIPAARASVEASSGKTGMDENKKIDLVICVSEAVTNMIKHAGGGKMKIYRAKAGILILLEDKGPGIDFSSLPEALLDKGMSGKISLGVGFTIMLNLLDKLYMNTCPEGTTLLMEMSLSPFSHKDLWDRR
ncbi:MAG: ATP-binding protein [Firmicutes bacterium]|nr:ATP-binding protein [Bacillota bacterium]